MSFGSLGPREHFTNCVSFFSQLSLADGEETIDLGVFGNEQLPVE